MDHDFHVSAGAIGDNTHIHPLEADEAQGVSQLMHEAYRDTYPEKFLYSPSDLLNKTENGELFSAVATDPEGRVIGHGTLRAYPGFPEIGLLGSLVVTPACRNRHLGRALARYLTAYGEKRGFFALTAGVFLSSLPSRKTFGGLGYTPSAIILGAYPQEISLVGIAERLSQRESLGFCTRLRSSVQYGPQYLPECYREMVDELCRGLGIRYIPGAEEDSGPGPTILEEGFSDESRVGRILVRGSGYNFRQAVAQTLWNLRARGAQSIWMHLDAGDPRTPAAAMAAEDSGFVFSGILPGKKGLILLHEFSREKISCDQIHLSDPAGSRLLAYIGSQRKPDLQKR